MTSTSAEAMWEQTWWHRAFQFHAHLHSTILYSNLCHVLSLAKFHWEILDVCLILKKCGPNTKHLYMSILPRQLLRKPGTNTHGIQEGSFPTLIVKHTNERGTADGRTDTHATCPPQARSSSCKSSLSLTSSRRGNCEWRCWRQEVGLFPSGSWWCFCQHPV